MLQWKTIDKERDKAKPNTRSIEREFRAKLRRVARHIGRLVDEFDPINEPQALPTITRMLDDYGESLTGWAELVSRRVVTSANTKDHDFWMRISSELSRGIRETLVHSSVEPVMEQLVREQVALIKSLPTEAAKRVGHLTQEALANGDRASEIAKEIARTGEVTESRATLIARTETARTASKLTQARADLVGSTQYIWRTAGDSDVRLGHKQMAGKVCDWRDPPAVNEGSKSKPHIMHHHPGEIWNCRCYAEPIIPE